MDDLLLFSDTATRFAGALGEHPLSRAAELGLSSLLAPAEASGLGLDVEALCAVLRPIAREEAGVAAALLAQASAQRLLSCGAWPASIAATDWLASPALAGARTLSLDARGRVRGQLPLVPLATEARHLVFTALGSDGGLRLLSRACDGLPRTPVAVLGLARVGFADVTLDDVPVDAVAPLDADAFEEVCAEVALGVTAVALGLLEGATATALGYAQARHQGGRAIVAWPEVRRMLGALRESILILDAALAGVLSMRRAASFREAAAALAARALDAVVAGTTDGVQLLGGNGYVKHYPQERRMRDARQLRASFGASPVRRRETFAKWMA